MGAVPNTGQNRVYTPEYTIDNTDADILPMAGEAAIIQKPAVRKLVGI